MPFPLSLTIMKKTGQDLMKKIWYLIIFQFKDKPWITSGLQKSISIKNQFLSKFSKFKDPCKKTHTVNRFIALVKNDINANLLSALLKKVNNFILPDLSKKILKT